MQAFQIAYSPDESKIALGWPTGLIEIAQVNPEDGSPATPLAHSFFHKKEITFLAFLNEEELLSVDERGRISVCAVASGDLTRELELGGEYVSAGLSPSRATLFVFAHESGHDTNTFAVDVNTFDVIFGPEASDLSVQSRVFAIDDRVAAFYRYRETDVEHDDTWEGDERIDEALVFIDFNSGVIDERVLQGGPSSTVSDFPVFATNAAHNIGLRCAFATPLEIAEADGKRFIDIKLEVFDLTTLEATHTISVGGVPIADNDDELTALVESGARAQEAYREKVSDLFENLTSLAITADAAYAWLGIRGGLVRRVRLDGSERSKVVKHGGEPERDATSLNEVFARNIRNNQTLGISPSGDYIAFSNPNEFFNPQNLELEGRGSIELPMRAAAATEIEAPEFLAWVAGGELVVVGTAGGFVFLVDPFRGDVLFAEQVPYGDHLNAASLSPNRRELILAYAGRSSLRVRFGDNGTEIEELPLPPHTVFAQHVDDELLVLANSNGAVVTIEGETLHAFRNDDDHGDESDVGFEDAFDEEDLDEEFDEAERSTTESATAWQLKNPDGVEPLQRVGNAEGVFVYNSYFEQKQDVYDVAGCVIDGRFHVFVLLEDGDIEAYRIGEHRIEHVFTHTGKWLKSLTAAGHALALSDLESGEAQLFAGSGDGLQKTLSFTDPGLRLAALSADGAELFLFNELTGVLSARDVTSGEERALLTYEGPAVRGMSLEPRSARATMIEGNGNCLLLESRAGKVLANLRVEASADGRRVTLGGEAVGTVVAADFSIERQVPSEAETRIADEAHSRKAELFSSAPRGEDERRVANELETAGEAIEDLVERGDFAGQVDLLGPLLEEFGDRDYFSVAGSNRFRTSIGAAFAQRGEAHRGLGNHEAAGGDFATAIGYHYYPAYLSRIEQLAFELDDHEGALALIDEVLVHFDAKSSIGLRRSTPLYRAQIYCFTRLGRVERARRSLTLVVENLVAYLEGGVHATELVSIKEDLAELATESETNRVLAKWFDNALANFPPKAAKDENQRALLDAALRRARFFELNGRQRELVRTLDQVLKPHDRLRYFDADMSNGAKHKLGDFWGLRGHARLRLGEARAALEDFRKAIEFRDVRRYPEALEVCLFDLGDFDAADELMASFVENPFNWGSEYWNPFERRDYPLMLALAALGDRLRGREGDLGRVRALYASEIDAVSNTLLEHTADRPQRFAAESLVHFLRS